MGEGRALVALVDVRPRINDTGPAVVETREVPADGWVYIPTGVAHGFLALEPLQLVYLLNKEYDGSDDLGIACDDTYVRVPWPAESDPADDGPLLS